MSNYENIEYILKKRQDNINNKKMWFDGLTDEEYKYIIDITLKI